MNAEEFYFQSYDLLSSWNEATNEKSKRELLLAYVNNADNSTDLTVNDFNQDLQWFNVSKPLTLASLKGKIVVLDFFTYCCINCMHILPDLEELESKYSSTDGVLVIGVHSAKFDNEKDSANIINAIVRYGIKHPVVNDSEAIMWSELQVSCWPTLLVLGPDTKPLVAFVGEGHREILLQFVSVAMDFYRGQGKITNEPVDMELCVSRLPPSPLLYPGKVSIRPDGHLLAIADTGHHRLVVTDMTGLVQHHIGSGEAGFADGHFSQCTFRAPQGVSWSEDGNLLYVADTENHAIRKVNMEKKIVETVVGTGTQGHDLEGGKICRDQCISSPWDVFLGKSKDASEKDLLYIAMAGSHQIWALILGVDGGSLCGKKYPQYTCIRVAGSGKEENRNNSYPHKAGFAQPSGICAGEVTLKDGSVDECLFIADSESSSVRTLSITGAQVKAVKALVGGARDPTDLFSYGDVDGESYSVRLQHPLGITARTNNRSQLVLADSYNHKIKLIETSTKTCETVYDGSGGALNEPGGICSHPTEDSVYIADTNNHSIKCLHLNTGRVDQIDITEHVTDRVVSMTKKSDQTDHNNTKPCVRLTNKRAERRRQALVHITHNASLHVTLTLQLAAGLHFTEGTTSAAQILIPDQDIDPFLHDGCEPKQIFSDNQLTSDFTLTFPRSHDLGHSCDFEVESIVYYCSDEGLCKMKATVFEIPVLISGQNETPDHGKGQGLHEDKGKGKISDNSQGKGQTLIENKGEGQIETTGDDISVHSVHLTLNIDL